MTAFLILMAGLVVTAVAASIRALRTDGYGRAPHAPIRRSGLGPHWR